MGMLLKVASGPKKVFNKAKKDLKEKGVRVYSMHNRIAIPKDGLKEDHFKDLGFKSTYMAIPEPGQARQKSWRHPDRYHIHDHGKKWVMHQDRHNPLNTGLKDKWEHWKDEGLPSYKHYRKWVKDGKGGILNLMEKADTSGRSKIKKGRKALAKG